MKVTSSDGATSLTLPYSLEQWAYIKTNYPRRPVAQVAAHLGVPPATLRSHVYRYRQVMKAGPSRYADYTASDLARACGCHPRIVTRWIATGALGQRRKAHRGLPYTFSDETLEKFLRAHPLLWRKYPVPSDVWQWVNGCGTYPPGSPAWYLALDPWPSPGWDWLVTYL